MPKIQKKKQNLPKVDDIKLGKISVFFKKSILKSILKILTMEQGTYRSFKAIKNINRLFTNLDLSKYQTNPEMLSYIWAINAMSKQWLDGILSPDIAFEVIKRHPEYTNVIGDIITASMNDKNIITPPEADAIFSMITEYLQMGFLDSIKEEYINMLEDIDMSEPGAHKQLLDRIMTVSQSMLDIKYNTNMVANKVEFSTADMDSIKDAISTTIESLSSGTGILKTGIRRLNTLLSPGFMDGRLYIVAGLPGSYKSGLLLKAALDIRKYNPGYQAKTPGMKPCCLYITMENTFTETIERIWNMTFDEPMTNYTEDQAIEMISKELGIGRIVNDRTTVKDLDTGETLESQLILDEASNEQTIEIVVQYYPYRSINTDDLYTIINDLRDENLEVVAFVFDYIKRIEPAHPVQDNERLELDRITNELKALAVIQNIPVITAHQLNRAGATAVDTAAKAGKHDLIKETGRDNIGGAHAILEVADWFAMVNTEYKAGTDDKYVTIWVVKRRRIDASEAEFAKYTYLAHPFAKTNSFRLVDDVNLDKVLSLQSLGSDINDIGLTGEKTNAVKRLQTIAPSEFNEDY